MRNHSYPIAYLSVALSLLLFLIPVPGKSVHHAPPTTKAARGNIEISASRDSIPQKRVETPSSRHKKYRNATKLWALMTIVIGGLGALLVVKGAASTGALAAGLATAVGGVFLGIAGLCLIFFIVSWIRAGRAKKALAKERKGS